ncbi:RAD52 [Candida theae]|uniref:DNA repair and recombination protein RAD52 n=1 Tax=Candida theae TaxID=1198502 RepID=A0AAD5BH62_9ASCO|nr:RAD52 [Candida theae]KAI5962775.1 RAD52 [Candida theae]
MSSSNGNHQPRRPTKPPLQHVKERSQPQQFRQFTEQETLEIQTKLNKALGPEYVSERTAGGGTTVQYIEGWKALNLANEVFGFNGWNSEVVSCEIDYLDTHGNTGRCSLGLSVVVRVTLKDGTFHEDIGYGFFDNARSKSQAFEKCKKEAYTDGIKRCLRCFGNVLGNCLYDKTIVNQIRKLEKSSIEYEPDDFHRDPIYAERERKKQMMEQREQEEREHEARREQERLQAPGEAFITPRSPSKVVQHMNKGKEADDIDESFHFSDDGAEEEHELMVNTSTQTDSSEKKGQEEEQNHFPAFVAAKNAALLQLKQDGKSEEIPQFDTTFVSPNIERTLDPTKSVPVKRAEIKGKTPPLGVNHLHNRVTKPSTNHLNNNFGKRIGVPPMRPPRRLHGEEPPIVENR